MMLKMRMQLHGILKSAALCMETGCGKLNFGVSGNMQNRGPSQNLQVSVWD